MKIFMEKSWNVKNWGKVNSHGVLTNFAYNFTPPPPIFRRRLLVKNSAFPDYFHNNVMKSKFEQRVGHGKSGNGDGKVMNLFFANSVGTLHIPCPNNMHVTSLRSIQYNQIIGYV